MSYYLVPTPGHPVVTLKWFDEFLLIHALCLLLCSEHSSSYLATLIPIPLILDSSSLSSQTLHVVITHGKF